LLGRRDRKASYNGEIGAEPGSSWGRGDLLGGWEQESTFRLKKEKALPDATDISGVRVWGKKKKSA